MKEDEMKTNAEVAQEVIAEHDKAYRRGEIPDLAALVIKILIDRTEECAKICDKRTVRASEIVSGGIFGEEWREVKSLNSAGECAEMIRKLNEGP